MNLVLASGSPRRRTLLGLLTDSFTVVVPDVDETLPPGNPVAGLEAVAARKANVVEGDVVLAADTAIIDAGQVLGKARDADDARAMLNHLNGRPHQVVTALALRANGHTHTTHVASQVTLALDDSNLEAYLHGREWEGKAGAYGLQDAIIAAHATVEGSWSNVVGLPLGTVHALLADAGLPTKQPPTEQALRAQNPF